MAFCIHDPLVPLTGGVSGGVLPAELQNFLYPPPPVLNLAHPVCKTLCIYPGTPSEEIGVYGGLAGDSRDFLRGCSRRKTRFFFGWFSSIAGSACYIIVRYIVCGINPFPVYMI